MTATLPNEPVGFLSIECPGHLLGFPREPAKIFLCGCATATGGYVGARLDLELPKSFHFHLTTPPRRLPRSPLSYPCLSSTP